MTKRTTEDVYDAVMEMRTDVAVLDSKVDTLDATVSTLPRLDAVKLAIAQQADDCHKVFQHKPSKPPSPKKNGAMVGTRTRLYVALTALAIAGAGLLTVLAMYFGG